ncbi:odorant receptor 59a-like [Cochliomyia hominivorax]
MKLETVSKFSKESLINSRIFFQINWKSWQFLGMIPHSYSKQSQHKEQYNKLLIWNYFVNFVATFTFPTHLIMGIFLEASTKSSLFENIPISLTCIGASIKTIFYAINMTKIVKMETILKELDERIQHEEDQLYYVRHIKRNLSYVQWTYVIIYLLVGFFASLAFILSNETRLFYLGWTPFDWSVSWRNYYIVLSYQFFCVFIQILQNFANDSFSPKALCALSGHIQLLYKRVARIGYDRSMSTMDNELELNHCVAHQKKLFELFDIIQEIISWPMFFQFFVSLTNLGVAMVSLLFFVTNIIYRIYYIVYFLGMIMQVFPVCYYGSDFVILFEKLHYAIFSCNWIEQSQRFKRHMMLFTERSLKKTMAMAGGMFPIHLTTFFVTIKGAYSMFAVIITMK